MIIQIVVALIVVGLLLWAVTQLPIDAAIAKLIRVVVIVIAVLWVISVLFGLPTGLPAMRGFR